MPKVDLQDFHTVPQYANAIETFARLSGHLLFEFERHPLDTKNLILRNFLARSITMLRGIKALWDIGDYSDCWILHRCLLDRYFHLVALGEDNSYVTFADWSFKRQYDAQNRVRSNPAFANVPGMVAFTPTPREKARYESISKSKPEWHRPKAQEVAKRKGVTMLYDHGYDHASALVHPMADDGHEDFFAITKLEPRPDFPHHVSVLHNSLFAACLIAIEVLNQSNFSWMTLVFDFYSQLCRFLDNGDESFKLTTLKWIAVGMDARLCEPAAADVEPRE